jgi:3-methylfumaryl-CoA hydratase
VSGIELEDLNLPAEQTSAMPAEQAALLAATLDLERGPHGELPLLWHWAYFQPQTPTAGLGPDGHPARTGWVGIEFPRRMWAGGEVTGGGLRTGVPATRRTRVLRDERKQGSTGEFLLVSLEHTIEQDGAAVITERQDLVYRKAGGTTPPAGPAVEPGDAGDWRETVVPSAALLFRFSAVTFNTHRIHYDDPYVRDVEGYPGLVVHGPLTAMLLAGSAARHLGGELTSFSFRASNPTFVDAPITIDGTRDGDGRAKLTARRVDGAVAMSATAAR